MAASERIAENAVESLYGDERLRSNLTDAEANIVLKWASDWLTEHVGAASDDATAQKVAKTETARVRSAVSALNALGKQTADLKFAPAVSTLEPILRGNRPFTREEIFKLLTALTTAAWQMRTS